MADGERELAMARWGMPSPSFALKGKATDPGVTNVATRRRRTGAAGSARQPLHRAVHIVLRIRDRADGKKAPVWFALDDSRPLAAFAGIWTNWTSVRKAKEGEVTTDVFAFLTTEPNAVSPRSTRRRCR